MKVITLMDLRKNGWGIEEEFGLKKIAHQIITLIN